MSALFYRSANFLCRFIKSQCIRELVLDRERADRDGGFILACTHLSHLEPMVVSTIVRRQVRWMARIEFYRPWWGTALLNEGDAFPVDRFGYSLPAVRTAVRLVRGGHLVGIFPEGGVAKGPQSVMNGASIKQGACTISIQTRAPVVPVVVLGTEELNRVRPWLPFKRGRLWVAFGRDVLPPPRGDSRRADRTEMAMRLRDEFVRTYRGLLETAGLGMESTAPTEVEGKVVRTPVAQP